jgi:hypothetical protein
VQGDGAGAAGGASGIEEVGVHDALGDVVKDRGGNAASEAIAGIIADAGEIEGPEADADDESVAGAGGSGQSESDRSAGGGLLVKSGPLDYRNGLRARSDGAESGSESEEREEEESRRCAYELFV